MTAVLKDLTKYTGTEVEGVDLSKPLDAATRALLNKTLADRAVLVFRNQTLDADSFCSAIENFGDLMQQGAKQFCLEEKPIVGFVSNRDKTNGVVITRGEQYHTDHSNYLNAPKATALLGMSIPTHGGDTQFVNTQAAFEQLPAERKAALAGLRSLHVGQSSRSPRKMASSLDGIKRPEALQPLVAINPDNGKPGLFLNTARMEGVEGMEPDAAYALIDELMAYATGAEFEYRHKWKAGDVVIWDNRSALHQANGDVPPEQYRYLLRLMVSGTPLDAFELAA